MNSDRFDTALEARLQAYLDGELSASDAAAFEADLRIDDALRHRVATLRGIEHWFRATRSAAPSSFERRMDSALAVESASQPAAPGRVIPLPSGGRRRRLLPVVGLAAAAALAVMLLFPGLRTPHSPRGTEPPALTGGSQSTSRPAAAEAANTVRYEFQFHAQDASEVCLVGDFNAWKLCDVRLERAGEDLWTIALQLPRGRHEYMFVVDGHWLTDPAAALYSDDGFGDRNAVVLL